MLFFRRYFASLAALSVAYVAYAWLIAPLVEPPPLKARQPSEPQLPVQLAAHTQADLAAYLPSNGWEQDAAKLKVIETDQATLLIQEYLPTPDGKLQLTPCTIIFYIPDTAGAEPKQANPKRAKSRGRPIVMRTQGAVLEFDEPLDLARAKIGKVLKGMLPGPITIFSPPTQPGAGDEFRLTTKDVRLDRDRIFTPHEVEFHYGQSFGRGRDLTITLLSQSGNETEGPKRSAGVQTITLARLDRLHIAAAGGNLMDESLGGAVGGQPKAAAPLELTCRGPFTYDVLSKSARFEDQVEVLRAMAGGPADRLHHCDELTLEFAAPEKVGEMPSVRDRPVAGHLQRIRAVGRPAQIDAPSSGLRVSAAFMEYSLAANLITLKSAEGSEPRAELSQVSLQQHDQHLIARNLHYEIAEQGKLGRLLSEGPGELRLLQGRAPARQTVVARWEKELRILPQERNQVISLEGAASVTVDPLGRFDANELHLWVVEVAENENASTTTGPEANTSPPTSRPRTSIVPDRLLAVGDVRLNSTQLDADAARLEAWFISVPAQEPQPTLPPIERPGPLREPVQAAVFTADASPQAAIRDVISPPSLQKFHLGGDLIRMQLLVQGRKFELEDLTIRGHALIDETRTAEPGQEPIHIAGDSLELKQGTSPQALIEVSGQLAVAGGRGLILKGSTIHVHRGENRLWIDGPGEASFPAPDGQSIPFGPRRADTGLRRLASDVDVSSRAQAAHVQKMNVGWQRGMTFDGQTSHLVGDIHVRGGSQRARCRALDATLSERIDFWSTRGKREPQLDRLKLDGDVFIENRGLDDRGDQSSLDQMHVPNLIIDLAADRLHADGPGWVSTVRRGNAAGPPGGPINPIVAEPPRGDRPLTSVHVSYQHAIEGSPSKRHIDFRGQVRTTYSPAQAFTDHIAVEAGQQPSDRAALMTSDRLTLLEMALPDRAPSFEVRATNNVRIDGSAFTLNAAKVGYTSDKETVTVEGDGRADAEIWYETILGAERSHAIARKFTYWLRSGLFKGEDFKLGDGWLNGWMQLPRR